MATNTTPRQKRTGARPAYVPLGTDSDGRHHVYRTFDESVHVVHPTHGRVQRQDVSHMHVDEWVDATAEQIGWRSRSYGRGLVGFVAHALEEARR